MQRVFLLRAVCRKGTKLKTSCMEVCRLWVNADGRMAVTSRARTLGWYVDSFNWCTGIDLKILSEVHWVISDTYVYPRYKVLPELRRNGMKGRLPDGCHPARLMKALLTDSRIETMMKSGDLQAVAYFVSRPLDLDNVGSRTRWPHGIITARPTTACGAIPSVCWSNVGRTSTTPRISVPKTSKPHMTVGWTKGTRRRRSAEVWNRC